VLLLQDNDVWALIMGYFCCSAKQLLSGPLAKRKSQVGSVAVTCENV